MELKKRKKKTNICDAYFIFADNVFANVIKYETFSNLLKFYALLYERILIADSFMLNNPMLHRFFSEEQGQRMLKEQVIVCTARENIKDFDELLYLFKQSRTLKPVELDRIKSIGEIYDFSGSVKFSIADVQTNFSEKVKTSRGLLQLSGEEAQIWEEALDEASEHGIITRQKIYDQAEKYFAGREELCSHIKKHADIIYNFNLPNVLHTAAAYPERLLSDRLLSPEKVFFPSEGDAGVQDGNILQAEDVFDKESILLDEPLMFYSTIISQLQFTDILEIRKTNEFKEYMNALKANDAEAMQYSFYEYCMMCNQLITAILSSKKQDIERLDKKLKITGKVQSTVGGVTSLSLGIVTAALPSVAGMAIDSLVSKGIELTGSRISRQMQMEFGLDMMQAKREVKRQILENGDTVLDEVAEAFQINRLEGDI